MGQYYTGRGVTGTIFVALAGAAVASGFMVRDVKVRCLNTPPSGGDCPPGDILDETTERPYLVPALGAAGAITIIGAVEAFIRARGRRAEQATAIDNLTSSAVRLSAPSVSVRGDRVDVNVLGLRFR
jgi:hypothetical protein